VGEWVSEERRRRKERERKSAVNLMRASGVGKKEEAQQP
jgi:hypothetical protein